MTMAAGPRREGLSPAGCSHACLKLNVWFKVYAPKWSMKDDWLVIRDRILLGRGKGGEVKEDIVGPRIFRVRGGRLRVIWDEAKAKWQAKRAICMMRYVQGEMKWRAEKATMEVNRC